MPVFFGEMKHVDHPKTMPAVVHVEKGTIRLQSGRTVLGEWKLYEVQIQERDSQTISFRVDADEVLLTLQQHDSFLAETASAVRDERQLRRAPVHEAFRKPDEGPTLGEELKEDVSKEVSGVADEVKAPRRVPRRRLSRSRTRCRDPLRRRRRLSRRGSDRLRRDEAGGEAAG